MRWSYLLLTLLSLPALAQESIPVSAPAGGGGYAPPPGECVSPALRAYSDSVVRAGRQQLAQRGILPAVVPARPAPLLSWPLQQAPGFGYAGIYGISNYVDHNQSVPNQIQDWNCGTRSYDQAGGYNHAGTDIFLWPFGWNMMDRDQAIIVAAAPGVILSKLDGRSDRNCAMSNATWNAVYVQHTDGSVAWYGHMKRSSLTTKAVGASVAAGEFLGLVGSSGSSTGPHLHFELHDANGAVQDPYTGSCNAGPSGWATQKPYYESALNAVLTHSAPPVFNACPAPDAINARDAFAPGDQLYCAAYFHDQRAGQVATYTIRRPDNSIFATWTHAMTPAHYDASYWYWTYPLPANAPAGAWRLTVAFEGTTVEHAFAVGVLGLPEALATAAAGFSLAPNPATRATMLELTAPAPATQVEIRNHLGQVVRRQTLGAQNTALDLADLSAGLYWVTVPGAGGRRLVVESSR